MNEYMYDPSPNLHVIMIIILLLLGGNAKKSKRTQKRHVFVILISVTMETKMTIAVLE